MGTPPRTFELGERSIERLAHKLRELFPATLPGAPTTAAAAAVAPLPLPPALTCRQWMAYTGRCRSEFFTFLRLHPAAKTIGSDKISRCDTRWARAMIEGRVDELQRGQKQQHNFNPKTEAHVAEL